ncbi:flagellar protein G [Thermococcus sp. P6]|uniref:flagellar protein G n=1 Tax=Thermococcus sp. P6 TaxID=122420 RepID=UPI000B59BD09|nr:flagellar protein G [Thermococcus sp. P6]ASJ11160.1 flagellar protein G [Thermococcus sp. P6]
MAAGGPASELIMFIVAIIIAGTVAGGLAYVTNDLARDMRVQGEELSSRLKSDFVIINDPENIPVSGSGPYDYTFYIKNTGKEAFAFSGEAVQVFIDGNIVPPSNLAFTDIDGNPISSLAPYEVGAITVTTKLTSGYHKLVVVLENGIQRSLVFRIS